MRELLAAAFDMQCVYRPDSRQATVTLTITDATPGLITALLADPRTDHDTATPGAFADMPSGAIAAETRNKARDGAAGRRDLPGRCYQSAAARAIAGAVPLTGKGYQIRKFPDLDIDSNTSTSVMAKTLFTAKVSWPYWRTNLRDHETPAHGIPGGVYGRGLWRPCTKETAGIAAETPYICSQTTLPRRSGVRPGCRYHREM
jgi:hypothetical protein